MHKREWAVCVCFASTTQPTGRDVEYAGSAERAAFPGQPGDRGGGRWPMCCGIVEYPPVIKMAKS